MLNRMAYYKFNDISRLLVLKQRLLAHLHLDKYARTGTSFPAVATHVSLKIWSAIIVSYSEKKKLGRTS